MRAASSGVRVAGTTMPPEITSLMPSSTVISR
jgi:hypothetical protein